MISVRPSDHVTVGRCPKASLPSGTNHMTMTPVFILFFLFVASAESAIASTESATHPDLPCDAFAAGGTPCVAAHSLVRALFADYEGPLYSVQRNTDGQQLGSDLKLLGGSS